MFRSFKVLSLSTLVLTLAILIICAYTPPVAAHEQGMAASPAASASASATPPEGTPTFSCCEKNIKITGGKAVPQKNGLPPGGITVTVDVSLNLDWDCTDLAQKDCLAFYNVAIPSSQWQQFVAGKWVNVPAADIKESVIANPPLKNKCVRAHHTGEWGFTYVATLTTLAPLRNLDLVFSLTIPANKGTSYTAKVTITDVTQTKPKPTVTIEKPKKAEEDTNNEQQGQNDH